MKIEKIICKRGFTLTLKFANGEILKADYTKQAATWEKAANKAYRQLADQKAFQSCRIDGGDLVFPAVKINGKTAYFDGASVYADCPKPKTRKPARKSCLSGIDGDTNTTTAATDPADIGTTISATDLMHKQFAPGLQFTGKWKDFLGEPRPNFRMLISSSPGYGKTTFCVQFANYLAANFGRVIFFENEMDDSRTQDVFARNAKNPSTGLDINFSCNTPDKIRRLLKNSKYDFVVIDSIQKSHFNEADLGIIEEEFPDKAFIAISQVDKKGTTRGSVVKQHEGDITIEFREHGIATTIKNRFGAVGREFQVF